MATTLTGHRRDNAENLVHHLRELGGHATHAEIMAVASRRRLRNGLRTGAIIRLLPGIYVAAEHASDYTVRCRAVIAWGKHGGMMTGPSAAYLHGMCDEPSRVWLHLPRHRNVRPPEWLTVWRPEHTVPSTVVRGIPAVTAAYAIIGLWRATSRRQRASTLIDAIRRSKINSGLVADVVRALPRVPERSRLLILLHQTGGGVQSFLELHAATRVFTHRHLAGLTRQHRIVAMGRTFYADLFHRQSRTAIELDGAAFHSGAEAQGRDRERDALFATLGIQTLRFSYDDIFARPQWCQRVALEVIRARLPRFPAET